MMSLRVHVLTAAGVAAAALSNATYSPSDEGASDIAEISFPCSHITVALPPPPFSHGCLECIQCVFVMLNPGFCNVQYKHFSNGPRSKYHFFPCPCVAFLPFPCPPL